MENKNKNHYIHVLCNLVNNLNYTGYNFYFNTYAVLLASFIIIFIDQ